MSAVEIQSNSSIVCNLLIFASKSMIFLTNNNQLQSTAMLDFPRMVCPYSGSSDDTEQYAHELVKSRLGFDVDKIYYLSETSMHYKGCTDKIMDIYYIVNLDDDGLVRFMSMPDHLANSLIKHTPIAFMLHPQQATRPDIPFMIKIALDSHDFGQVSRAIDSPSGA